MARSLKSSPADGPHGATQLPSVIVTSYNLEARDEDGFVGDRARRGVLFERLEELRTALRQNGEDPIDKPSEELKKKDLDAILEGDDAEAAALVHSAIEKYADALASVVRRFSRFKAWSDVERIVVGGGFRQSKVGELAIGRAGIILRTEQRPVELVPIRHDPDEAGLLATPTSHPNGCSRPSTAWSQSILAARTFERESSSCVRRRQTT